MKVWWTNFIIIFLMKVTDNVSPVLGFMIFAKPTSRLQQGILDRLMIQILEHPIV